MRQYGGIDIDAEFLEELRDDWIYGHDNVEYEVSFEDFVRNNTGMSQAEFEAWHRDGTVPE